MAGEVVDDLTKFLDAGRGTNAPWADARVYNTRIRRNIKLAESSSFGQTVFDYAPRSNGAIDYARLAVEIFGEDAAQARMADHPIAASREASSGAADQAVAITPPDDISGDHIPVSRSVATTP